MVRMMQGSSMLRTYIVILFMLVIFVLVFLINSTTKFLSYHVVKADIPNFYKEDFISVNRSEFHGSHTTNITATIATKITVGSTTTIKAPAPITTARQDVCDGCFKHDFKGVINNDNICNEEAGVKVDLLVMILTEHSHLEKRNAIRNSWMQVAKNNTANVRYAFALGETKNEVLREKVLNESIIYKDILKEDFVDSYNNLTLKTIMSFKYAALHCPNTKYVMKTDDDMWVNINGLLKLLEKQGDNMKKIVGGSCAQVASPIRDHRSKWYASKLSYPHDRYPGFCSGTGYVTSLEVARKIYEISATTPFFHLEDVYVAICIRRLGLKLQGLPGFHPYRPKLPWCKYKADNIITIHQVPPGDLLKIWSEKC